MRAILVIASAGLILAASPAQADSLKFRCVSSGDPKAPGEDYLVDGDDNTVTVTLHDKRGNVLSSKTYPAKISATAIDWAVDKAGGTSWTLHYDRAAKTLISSNSDKESFSQTCK